MGPKKSGNISPTNCRQAAEDFAQVYGRLGRRPYELIEWACIIRFLRTSMALVECIIRDGPGRYSNLTTAQGWSFYHPFVLLSRLDPRAPPNFIKCEPQR